MDEMKERLSTLDALSGVTCPSTGSQMADQSREHQVRLREHVDVVPAQARAARRFVDDLNPMINVPRRTSPENAEHIEQRRGGQSLTRHGAIRQQLFTDRRQRRRVHAMLEPMHAESSTPPSPTIP